MREGARASNIGGIAAVLGAAGAGHLNIGGSRTRRRRRLWRRAWLSALQEMRIALVERHIPGRSKTARVGMCIPQPVAHGTRLIPNKRCLNGIRTNRIQFATLASVIYFLTEALQVNVKPIFSSGGHIDECVRLLLRFGLGVTAVRRTAILLLCLFCLIFLLLAAIARDMPLLMTIVASHK